MELSTQPAPKLRPNPIKFPRFTFVIGDRADGVIDLSKALVKRDTYMEAASMWTPIYEAAAVFWEGEFDLFPQLLAQSSSIPSDLWDFVNDLMKFPFPLLSRVAMNRVEHVLDITADRILFIDAVYDFIPPFTDRWGRADCAVIQLGVLKPVPPTYQGAHTILASDKLDERLAQLEREFGVVE